MAQNDSLEFLERWRSGTELSFAWFEFSDPYALAKFREMTSLNTMMAQEALMVADLWMRLRSKELQAYGNCVAPIISNGPILIPLHMFEFAPPRELSSSDNIENFGWRFEGVKVCSARDDALEAQIHGLIMSDFIESRIGEAAKRGGGAKNRYGDVREILIRLFNERPKVRGESAANLLASFNKLYIEAYSSDDIKRGAISETSLRQHLKAYRQELVKIGNN